MNAPAVKSLRTKSGDRIAYWTVGSGPALILPSSGLLENTELSWQHEPFRWWIEALAEHRSVTFFDFPGMGLSSERAVADSTLTAYVGDLDALVDAVSPSARCTLLACSFTAAPAIAFATERPHRIDDLIIVNGIPSAKEYRDQNPAIVTREIAGKSPGLYASVAAAINAGSDPQPGTIDHLRSVIGAHLKRIAEYGGALISREYEVTTLASEVQAHTLIVQARSISFMDESIGRRLAARIEGAELLMTDGDTLLPYLSDADTALDGVLAFLGISASPADHGAVQTILFTDLAGSTAMQSRLGDEEAREVVRTHDETMRRAISEFNGREIKHTGDGVMASFGSASDAVSCALAARRDIDTQNATPDGEKLLVRFGLNAGEPIAEDGDLFGLSVSLAARIGDWGGPGQVLCSNVVRELLLGKGFDFTPVGDADLKGLDEPMTLFEVSSLTRS